jgi:hypothetical protein
MMEFCSPQRQCKYPQAVVFLFYLTDLIVFVDLFAAVLTTNIAEMGGLVSLFSLEGSKWLLLRLITGSLPNVQTKQEGGVQHNGMCNQTYLYCMHTHYFLIFKHSFLPRTHTQ